MMNRAHVFVVNERTFPYHLRYRFAGTTAGHNKAKHIGLLADIARTRRGDKVLFYLQKVGFFGVFEVESEYPMVEPLDGWLQQELGVPLIYRIRIRPAEVYPIPVSEWEAVDELPKYSRDIRWSLIYRKLKGERGCSYLFPHEYDSMIQLMHSVNKNQTPLPTDSLIEYDSIESCIRFPKKDESQYEKDEPQYEGSQETAEAHLFPVSSESKLQAWLTWHIGRNEGLNDIIPPEGLSWFANEVYAGVGMQKIDLLCIWQRDGFLEYGVYELKGTTIKDSDISSLIKQTQRYIWWLSSYVRQPKDRVKVVLVVKGWRSTEQRYKELVKELVDKESQHGSSALQVWKWQADGNNPPTFNLIKNYSVS